MNRQLLKEMVVSHPCFDEIFIKQLVRILTRVRILEEFPPSEKQPLESYGICEKILRGVGLIAGEPVRLTAKGKEVLKGGEEWPRLRR
jgi:AMMECR1 domain-containing protein